MASVFATKFSPDLNSETLAGYLKNKMSRDVVCLKIATEQTRYSSFKVTAECKEVGEMYDPQLWPEGTFVRRFYESRKPGANANIQPALRVQEPDAGVQLSPLAAV